MGRLLPQAQLQEDECAFTAIMDREIREDDRWLDLGYGTWYSPHTWHGGVRASLGSMHRERCSTTRIGNGTDERRRGIAMRQRTAHAWSERDAFDGLPCSGGWWTRQ